MKSLPNINKLFIYKKEIIRKALELLNTYQIGIILVIDKDNKLLGTLTDGDIRRGLLSGKVLETEIKDIMNQNFIYMSENEDYKNYQKILIKKSIKHLPVIDKEGKIIDLLISNEYSEKKSLSNPVVIMAGGIGSRLRPYTNNCPKPMLEINGKPILEILIEQCIDFGFQDFFLSVNYLKDIIINYFGDGSKWGIKITYLEESNPCGTAGSLRLLPKNIEESFLVINGDVLTKFNPYKLLEFHNYHKALATLSVREHILEIPFGVIETKGVEVKEILEKPSYKKLVNAGVYALDPAILKFINDQEKIDMPELFNKAIISGSKIVACPIHEYWIDIGRPETLEEAYTTWDVNPI